MSKLIKSEVLLKEAKKDLEHGSPNKAVSASYFAVRLFVEHVIPDLLTSKDDKIANALYREVKRRANEEVAKRLKDVYMTLYTYRKMADHRETLFELEESKEIVKMAESLILEIKRIWGLDL